MRKDVSHGRFSEFLHWRGHWGKMSSAFIAYFPPLWILSEPIYQIQKKFPNKFSSQPAMNIWNSISTLFAAVGIYYYLTGEGLFRNLPILTPGMNIVHYGFSN
jgi:hypothetical protein